MEYLDITYRLFGEGEPTDMELPKLPKLDGAVSGESRMNGYIDAAKALRTAASAYEDVQDKVAEKVAKTKEMSKTGRENIGTLLDEINTYANSDFNDMSFLSVVESAFMAVDGVREIATKEAGGIGNDLRTDVRNDIKRYNDEAEKARKAQEQRINDALAGIKSPVTPGPGPQSPGPQSPGPQSPGTQNPPPWLNDKGPKQPGTTPDPTRPGTINPPGTITPPTTKPPTSGVKPPVSDIKPPTTTPPISTPPRVNSPISSPGLGGMPGMGMGGMPGMGMGMPGMGMPGMGMPGMYNDQMARRNELDRDLARRRDEMDSNRDKPRDVVPPRSAVQQAAAQPNGANPVANAQHVNANPNVTAAPGAGTPPPGGQVPGPVPNADGKVPFDFPGRPTLMVSQAAHAGMTAAVANKKGTDAKAAYAQTAAKWNDDKKIGLRTDPSTLVAGDVISWKDTTAIVVVWPKGEVGADAAPVSTGDAAAGAPEGPLEIIANGELLQVTGDMMKEEGPYGAFNGFFHPNGIDAVPPADAGAAGGAPMTADQQPTVVA
ncbi:hypothetical protein ACFXNW_20370 [Nocardia sp. NPDC059180]|uniref:hypothetical protein n=1 Tax=Nocardia sp. NPDC059180 TaxID=3346761 RepID=UPI0036940770